MIKRPLYSLLAFLCVLLVSCKKTDSNIGKDILPDQDILGATYSDTSSIVCYSIIDDSLRTDENYVGGIANLLGSMADPVFGRTDASFYVNLSNPNNVTNIGFGPDPKLDSVVLMLAYQKDAYYGDVSDPMLLNVYRLNEQLYYDSSYYSYEKVPCDSTQDLTYSGAGKTTVFASSAEVYDGDTKYAPHLRVKLKNEVGQQFIDDTTKLASTTTLREYFKGLKITTENTVIGGNDYGSIGYFDLTNPLSKVSIYYHNGTDLTVKRVDLTMTSASARYNHFKHDYTNAVPELKSQLDATNLTAGNTNLFMQGMAGCKIKMSFPHLKHFSDSGKVAINKAEIVYKVDKSSNYYEPSKYLIPARTTMEGLTSTNAAVGLIIDQGYDQTGLWGYYDATNEEYHFPISYSVQKLANGDYSDFKFTMRIFQHHSNPSRVVLGGINNAAYPAKLKIWYTRIK